MSSDVCGAAVGMEKMKIYKFCCCNLNDFVVV